MHDRDRSDPALRLHERRPGLRGLQTASLEPEQRRDRLQVVLHAVMDLADRRVLRQQHAVAAAEVGDVTHQEQGAGGDVVLEEGQHPQEHRNVVALDLVGHR